MAVCFKIFGENQDSVDKCRTGRGEPSAPRIAFLHFGLGGDFWKAGGDRLFQTIKREPGWSRNGYRPR